MPVLCVRRYILFYEIMWIFTKLYVRMVCVRGSEWQNPKYYENMRCVRLAVDRFLVVSRFCFEYLYTLFIGKYTKHTHLNRINFKTCCQHATHTAPTTLSFTSLSLITFLTCDFIHLSRCRRRRRRHRNRKRAKEWKFIIVVGAAAAVGCQCRAFMAAKILFMVLCVCVW